MITFLVVYKHNVSNSFNNMIYMCDGAPCLSEIKMRIMDNHKWKEGDYAIINLIPVKNELETTSITHFEL